MKYTVDDLEDLKALRAAKDAERDEPTVPLDATLQDLRAYRESDPQFERAITDYVDAEASLQKDPAEGQKADVPAGTVGEFILPD
ncbi:MAG TPA: hypothetical protein VLE27_11290 [Thermoanaerobaculia bacterium]|nr:hypothetical protein [Thermoanaerobaculia bacterium]